MTNSSLPYKGVRVLDLSQGLAGPYCTMLLAQWGAEVIKVEPRQGDWIRQIGALHGPHSALSLTANRGKHSLAVDLKSPQGVEAVLRLAAQCDVFIESFRPGVISRLGLGYEEVMLCNSDVVYLSVSGFGQKGAYAELPGSDSVMQAFSGMMSINCDEAGLPRRSGMLTVDMLTGLYAFQAVAPALHARLNGQGGRYLDINLMQATAAFLAPQIIDASLGVKAAQPLAVPSGVYGTSDGFITIAISNEAQFGLLCQALGRDDLASNPSYATFALRGEHVTELRAALDAEIAARSTESCLALLQAHKVLVGRVNTLQDWLDDPLRANATNTQNASGQTDDFEWPGIPGVPEAQDQAFSGHWPTTGGESVDVLARSGFSKAEIQALLQAGIVSGGAPEQ